jgi:hypothetical protein
MFFSFRSCLFSSFESFFFTGAGAPLAALIYTQTNEREEWLHQGLGGQAQWSL